MWEGSSPCRWARLQTTQRGPAATGQRNTKTYSEGETWDECATHIDFLQQVPTLILEDGDTEEHDALDAGVMVRDLDIHHRQQ